MQRIVTEVIESVQEVQIKIAEFVLVTKLVKNSTKKGCKIHFS